MPDLNLGRERAQVAERMQLRGWHPLLYAVLENRPKGEGWQKGPPRDVAAILRAAPAYNLGWRMGVQPNGRRLLGLDDDGELEAVESILGALPETWTQRTPRGGAHVVFSVPPEIPFTNSANILVGQKRYRVDVRCDGAALCLAPSERRDGVYVALPQRPIAPLPERWVSALRYVAPPALPEMDPKLTPSLERALLYTSHCEPAISGSGGHRATFRVALLAVQFGLDLYGVMTVLRAFNERCMPQWTEVELRHKASQAIGNGRVVRGGKLCARAAEQRKLAGS